MLMLRRMLFAAGMSYLMKKLTGRSRGGVRSGRRF
jgi:hypothetical protein